MWHSPARFSTLQKGQASARSRILTSRRSFSGILCLGQVIISAPEYCSLSLSVEATSISDSRTSGDSPTFLYFSPRFAPFNVMALRRGGAFYGSDVLSARICQSLHRQRADSACSPQARLSGSPRAGSVTMYFPRNALVNTDAGPFKRSLSADFSILSANSLVPKVTLPNPAVLALTCVSSRR